VLQYHFPKNSPTKQGLCPRTLHRVPLSTPTGGTHGSRGLSEEQAQEGEVGWLTTHANQRLIDERPCHLPSGRHHDAGVRRATCMQVHVCLQIRAHVQANKPGGSHISAHDANVDRGDRRHNGTDSGGSLLICSSDGSLLSLTEREQAQPSPFFARAPRDPTPWLRPVACAPIFPLQQQPLTPHCSCCPACLRSVPSRALQERPAPPFSRDARAECRGVPRPAGMMVWSCQFVFVSIPI